MVEEVTRFDAEIFGAVNENILQQLDEFVDRNLPLEAIAAPLNVWKPAVDELLRVRAPAEILYYILLSSREFLPNFFPVHDINALTTRVLAKRCPDAQCIVILDWEMLPAAVLLSGAAKGGRHFVLPPPLPGQEMDARNIVAVLEKYLPDHTWEIEAKPTLLDKGCLVLGKNPLRHSERDACFLERLSTVHCGVFYSTWDFLGVKIYAHTRSHWLKSGLIRSIVQLPRPRRQGTMVYPALIFVGENDDKHRRIRMARIATCRPGPGGLDVSQAVLLLEAEPDGINTADISAENIARDGLFDLSPAIYLAQNKMPAHSGGTLRHYAAVLRCQLPRERIEDEIVVPEGEEWAGEYPDGSFIGREVSLNELDPLTGFLDEYGGNIVKLALTRMGKQGKYLLQAGDILFAFRGTAASVGKVGFAEDEGIPGITGQALCIIRPLPSMDPVWLYYYLQRRTVRAWVQSRATGSTLLTINLESIRDIPIPSPGAAEVNAVNAEHRKVTEAMVGMAAWRREARAALRRIRNEGEFSEERARGGREEQHKAIGGGPAESTGQEEL